MSFMSLCVLKGEDGEAGDPGAVGLPGRIVSVFTPCGWNHHALVMKWDPIQAVVLRCSSTASVFSPQSASLLLGRQRGSRGEGRYRASRSSRSPRSQRPPRRGWSQGQRCKMLRLKSLWTKSLHSFFLFLFVGVVLVLVMVLVFNNHHNAPSHNVTDILLVNYI